MYVLYSTYQLSILKYTCVIIFFSLSRYIFNPEYVSGRLPRMKDKPNNRPTDQPTEWKRIKERDNMTLKIFEIEAKSNKDDRRLFLDHK